MAKTHDAMGRAVRWKWPKKVGEVVLTEYDLLIFYQLMRYRYLRRDLLARLLPPRSANTFPRRLRELFRARYLMRPESQKFCENAHAQFMYYAIAPKGEEALLARQERPLAVTQVRGSSSNFAHDAAGVCNVMASIEAGARAQGYRLVTLEEVLDRMKEPPADPLKFPTIIEHRPEKFRPDGFFGLYKEGRVSFFMHEHERANGGDVKKLRQASWRKKVLAYQHVFEMEAYKERLGIPNLRVIVTTTSAKKARNLAKLTEELVGPTNRFLFHHVRDLGREAGEDEYPDLFAEEWLRAGREPTKLVT
ncbi:hypothetical protein ACRDNQ_03900 [Palleronia sp. KMU-117]|uniref:hypothetical protein n=1 Tax=Palleronia sp. KMU-117 TaxID=3434108 RepID=UPI003D70BB98